MQQLLCALNINFFIRLCHKEWLIYSKTIFARLTRKIQVRRALREGSIPSAPLRVGRQGVSLHAPVATGAQFSLLSII